jgi:hypothetical protein
MSVGRRSLYLPLAFVALAVAITSTAQVRAQERQQQAHRLWQNNLTPEQIKAALARIGQGDGPDLSMLQKLLQDYIQNQPNDFDKQQFEERFKQFTSNKQLMDQLQQMAKQRQKGSGQPFQFTPDELAKLKLGLNTPPANPDLGTTTPNIKPPVIGELPFTKKQTGDPVPPKTDRPPFPQGDPRVQPPTTPPDPANPPSLQDQLFRPPDEPTDPRSKSLQAFAAIWERNIGPLDQTPEVRRALFDLMSDSNGLDLDLKDGMGNSVWDLLRNGEGSGMSFDDFMQGSDTNWKFPQFEFPKFDLSLGGGSSWSGGSSSSSWWGGSRSSSSRSRGGSSGSGIGSGGFSGSWTPLVFLGLIVLAIVLWVLVKRLRETQAELAVVSGGLGPWPIDPRAINTREDVVKAFEYLSVLICGPSAKNWTHGTIAEALTDLAVTHGETAMMLARLYELARYAPLDEPLSRNDLIEARELVCDLAGVSY